MEWFKEKTLRLKTLLVGVQAGGGGTSGLTKGAQNLCYMQFVLERIHLLDIFKPYSFSSLNDVVMGLRKITVEREGCF